MKKSKLLLNLMLALFVTAASLTLYSCYPYNSTNPSEYDVVVTLHDDLSNFRGQYKKYVMRDSIAHISDGTGSGSVTREYDNLIRTKVVNNLTSLGYMRVTDTASADVIITLAAAKSTSVYVNSYYPDPYWFWGYGPDYYYPWTAAYAVTTGSVITTIYDKNKFKAGTTQRTAVWMGILNGVLNGADATSRISSGIDKAFSQSQYLKAAN